MVLLFVIQDTKVHFHLAEFCTEVSLQCSAIESSL